MADPRPYAEFDELISMLRAEGHVKLAQRLYALLHEVAWTTGSELTGQPGLEILKFQRCDPSVSAELKEVLRRCMAAVKQVWPGIEKAR